MSWRERLHPLSQSVKQAVAWVRQGNAGPLAIALAGGGARASFQIGALAYLYDVEGLDPDIFTGTSAGAILASALAQYDDPADQRKALAQVDEIWSTMNSSSEMFEEREWFEKLRSHLPTWMKVVALRQDSQRKSLTQNVQEVVADFFKRRETDHEHHAKPPEVAEEEHHESRVSGALNTLYTLWEGARSATDLQQIVRGFGSEASAFVPGPMVQRLLEPEVFDPKRLAQSSRILRIAVVGLESGKLRYVTGKGELRDELDRPLDLPPVDYVDAVTASCAIPGVFPPVELDGEHYVDGGIRANLPTDVAFALGAGRVIAIISGARGPSEDESFANGDLLEIMMRSAAGIMPDELEALQVRLARAQGAIVINPVVDVHDALTVDPGLVAIAKDYGWMRAHDIMTEASPEAQQLTHDIIDFRRHLWAIEDRLFGAKEEPEDVDVALEELGELKQHLRLLLVKADPGGLPEGAMTWWRTWEKHPFGITHEIDWLG